MRGLIAHSGLICIDIDEKDNPDVAEFDRLNELIRIIPYVVYCGHSIGGKGYFVIIPIASPEKHKEHFEALRQDFARCGITIDKSGKDVTRLRIYSYDNTAYINPSAATYERTATVRTIHVATDYNKPRISTPKEKSRTPGKSHRGLQISSEMEQTPQRFMKTGSKSPAP